MLNIFVFNIYGEVSVINLKDQSVSVLKELKRWSIWDNIDESE